MKLGTEHKQFVLYRQTEKTLSGGAIIQGAMNILHEADTMQEIQSKMQDVLADEYAIKRQPNDFIYHNPRPKVAEVVMSDVAQCLFIGTGNYNIWLTRNTDVDAPAKNAMTQAEALAMLEKCQTASEWESAIDDHIKPAWGGGQYPEWWFASVLLSGLAERVTSRWNDSGLEILNF